MKMKKFLALALSVGMVMGTSVTAFASGGDPSATTPPSTTLTGDVETPTVSVTVPTDTTIIVNPYALTVDKGGTDVTDQIVYVDGVLSNEGDSAILVSATITGEIPENSKAVFASTPITGSTKAIATKSVYMFAQFSQPYAEGGTATFASDTYVKDKDALVSTKAVVLEDALTLSVKGATEDTSQASLRILGDANGQSEEVWAETDTVSVKIVYEFLPVYVAPKPAS